MADGFEQHRRRLGGISGAQLERLEEIERFSKYAQLRSNEELRARLEAEDLKVSEYSKVGAKVYQPGMDWFARSSSARYGAEIERATSRDILRDELSRQIGSSPIASTIARVYAEERGTAQRPIRVPAGEQDPRETARLIVNQLSGPQLAEYGGLIGGIKGGLEGSSTDDMLEGLERSTRSKLRLDKEQQQIQEKAIQQEKTLSEQRKEMTDQMSRFGSLTVQSYGAISSFARGDPITGIAVAGTSLLTAGKFIQQDIQEAAKKAGIDPTDLFLAAKTIPKAVLSSAAFLGVAAWGAATKVGVDTMASDVAHLDPRVAQTVAQMRLEGATGTTEQLLSRLGGGYATQSEMAAQLTGLRFAGVSTNRQFEMARGTLEQGYLGSYDLQQLTGSQIKLEKFIPGADITRVMDETMATAVMTGRRGAAGNFLEAATNIGIDYVMRSGRMDPRSAPLEAAKMLDSLARKGYAPEQASSIYQTSTQWMQGGFQDIAKMALMAKIGVSPSDIMMRKPEAMEKLISQGLPALRKMMPGMNDEAAMMFFGPELFTAMARPKRPLMQHPEAAGIVGRSADALAASDEMRLRISGKGGDISADARKNLSALSEASVETTKGFKLLGVGVQQLLTSLLAFEQKYSSAGGSALRSSDAELKGFGVTLGAKR